MGPKNRKPRAKAPVTDTTVTAAASDTTTIATTAPNAATNADTNAITDAGTGEGVSTGVSTRAGANASNRGPKAKAKPKAGQYHHIIPRFILRKFIIEGHKNPEANRRGKSAAPGLTDPINCYHVSSGTFSISSLNNSYGVTDLYINIKNPDNAYEVEKKLSVLESHAAQAIGLLLKTVESRPPGDFPSEEPQYFRIKRKFLNYLRKFMFIMYFRNDGFGAQHFNEHHPDNSGGAAWIRAFRQKNNLEPSEMWLHVLEHYLDTPHVELVKQGQKANDQLDSGGRAGSRRGIDPNIQDAEMIQYWGEANNFFLAVWEAADCEEFIISNNSFGLWESVSLGDKMYQLHRFYVISPRIAIVLCFVRLRPDIPPIPEFELMYRESIFWGAPHRSPRVSKDGQIVGREVGVAGSYEEDIMEYEIVKLSTEFTHRVNAVIMGNARIDTGTITFRTPAAMLRTLEAYSRNMGYDNQKLYEPLVEQLLKMTGASSSTFRVIPNPNPTSRTHALKPPKAGLPSFWEINLEMLDRMEEDKNDEISAIFKTPLKRLIEQIALKISRTPYDINPKPARLRRNISDESCVNIFAMVKGFIKFLGLGMSPLFPECTMIAVLRWLLAERRNMFEILERKFSLMMMEWVYDEPDREKREEEYRIQRAKMFQKD
ncbi:uncharacterized protein LAJ45_08664 [Morchella importuna]|uniref:uncharacterized protein n=1 Tax=Morchella importuna TaxID=1174673 RepID=UPI001E8E0EA2|nr:uncharacterized protein LAJ45_08664 [Morchella importuna]KAH8147186.1 hypothetical protein LAJ45_08664 [Morchella importuna]